MSRRTASRVAWTLVVSSMLVGLAGSGLKLAVDGFKGWHFVANDGLPIAIFFAAAIVGALVASRFPSNAIGWILVGMAFSLGVSGAADAYVVWSLDRGHDGGLIPWAAKYSSDVYPVFFVTLLLVPLLFPNGRLLTRRWRFVLWGGLLGIVLLSVSVVTEPGKVNDYPSLANPAGVKNGLLHALAPPGFFLFVGGMICSAASAVLRFRRARGIERQQLTVLAAAGILAALAFLGSAPAQGLAGSEDLGIGITLAGVLAIPLAIGVAMLRYRLYDIDRVISRTLVYGALTLVLGAAYAGLVLAGQAVFSSFAGGSNLAIAGSTLVVAALFLPLRGRVQRFVDRRFYRRRYDAQRTLEAFGARLREQVELDGLRGDLEAVVRDTVQPAHVSLWLRGGAPS